MMSKEADILYLSWKYEHKEMIYFPKSTWTEGRNRLYEEGLKLGKKYEYYIFLDDDISFIEGSFSLFEQYLLKYKPAIATPLYYCDGYAEKIKEFSEVSCIRCLDACYNSFHHSVVFDDILFPLNITLDKHNWFSSQYILNCLANIFYLGYIHQFGFIHITNNKNRNYIKGEIADTHLKNSVMSDKIKNKIKDILFYSIRLRVLNWSRMGIPMNWMKDILSFIYEKLIREEFVLTKKLIKNKILFASKVKHIFKYIFSLYYPYYLGNKQLKGYKNDYTIPKELKEHYFINFEEYKLNRTTNYE